MFLRWLLTKFPGEMRAGWRLVRADLLLWIAVAAVVTASGFTSPPVGLEVSPAVSRLIAAVIGTFLIIMMTLRFDAASSERCYSWADVFSAFAHRALAMAYFLTVSMTITLAADSAVRIAVYTLLDETPVRPYAVAAVGVVVFVTLLTRFCFVAYLVVLDRREAIDVEGTPGMRFAPLAMLAWPLLASSRMSDGIRWSLAPYIVLSVSAPLPAVFMPPMVGLPVVIVLQLVAFTAMAVLFDYYRAQREQVASG